VKHQGLTIFVLFFALSLLDALQGGRWVLAMGWLLLGLFFLAMDRPGKVGKPG
jgi:hypothetical protein